MDFYTILSKYFHVMFPANPKEKNLLDNAILEKRKKALDIGCGIGNTTSFLESYVDQVIGIDLNLAMIEKAKENNPSVEFLLLDMKQIHTLSPMKFDVITCFGNTLVHVNNEDVYYVLQQINKQTNQDAQLFIQIINYDRIYKNNVTSLPLIDNQYVTMQRKYTLYDECIVFTSVLLDKETNETATQSITLYPLFYKQLSTMLQNAGFKIEHSYGNFDQDPWHQDSYATIIHAIKKDQV